MRGFSDGDAPCPQGLQGARRRPGRFPSDTISTHLVHPPGVAALTSGACWTGWSRRDARASTRTRTTSEPSRSRAPPGPLEAPLAYAPRRTVLDALLVEAASEAGAEVREGFTVDDLEIEDGRVYGIRGHAKDEPPVRLAGSRGGGRRRSPLPRRDRVGPEQYNEKPPLQVSYYTYLSGLPMNGRYECSLRPGRGFAAWPTNDDLTVVIAGWPRSELAANRQDIEGNWIATLELVPEFADPVPRRYARDAGSSVSPCRTSCASPSDRAGPWWATPGTRRTSSRHSGSATPSATPSCAPPLSTRRCRARASSRPPWPSIRPSGTGGRCRSTSSRRTRDARAPATRAPADPGSRRGRPGRDGCVRTRRGAVTSPADFFDGR